FQIFQILGSLGVFFYGMKGMSEAIQRLTGDKLRASLSFITNNRFKGILTGFFITSIIQSSSATTVMVVSFVNAGLLTLFQSIGVIMGANLGTTVTFWIISYLGFKISLSSMAIPIIGIGIPFIFSKKSKWNNIGEMIVGFGILFMGIELLKNSVPDIKNHPEMLQFLTQYTDMGMVSILLFVFVGILLTVIVQSSSAAGAITVTMAFNGWIDFPIAAAIVLGENIGTTITAYLASIGANVDAKRAARAHMLFNVIGVAWMLVLFKFFIHFVSFFVPGDPAIPENIPLHIAAFHSLFNLCNILVLVAFVPQIAKIVEKLVRPKVEDPEKELTQDYTLEYISTRIVRTPEMRLYVARIEIIKMSILSHNMFQEFLEVFFNQDKDMGAVVKKVKQSEVLMDKMKDEITRYLAKLSREKLLDKSSYMVTAMMRVVNEIESIADCCFNLVLTMQKKYNQKIELHPTADAEIREFSEKVIEFIMFNIENLQDAKLTDEDIEYALELEDFIDASREALRESSVNRISESGKVRAEMIFMDIIKNFERIGDYSLNIAEAMKRMVD
ncbi:Na/Pi cotransporter family protein, partial [bacterium]|nr:Na/Pi cotransporter family protein [bacterium]